MKGKLNYEETQILKDKSNFFSEIKNKSLFDEKEFLIERCTDKISEIVLKSTKRIMTIY